MNIKANQNWYVYSISSDLVCLFTDYVLYENKQYVLYKMKCQVFVEIRDDPKKFYY